MQLSEVVSYVLACSSFSAWIGVLHIDSVQVLTNCQQAQQSLPAFVPVSFHQPCYGMIGDQLFHQQHVP